MTFYRQLNFQDVSLYAVSGDMTDETLFLETIDKLLAGGIDAFQLRTKSVSDKKLVELGKKIKEKCAKNSTLLIVNNRPDIALAVDADGVHLGHEDLPIAFARELLGHRRIIGVSTHSLPQAIDAQRRGADYVSCGPIWATPTKPTYEPVTPKLIGLYKAALHIPFVAIGGIDETNIEAVVAAGAKTVAVVRALFNAANPEETAKNFKLILQKNQTKILV